MRWAYRCGLCRYSAAAVRAHACECVPAGVRRRAHVACVRARSVCLRYRFRIVVAASATTNHPTALCGAVLWNTTNHRHHARQRPPQTNHASFKRKGHDLLVKKEVSLMQALCGLSYELEKLDGTRVRLQNTRSGACIKPNSIMVVEDLGMPKPGSVECVGVSSCACACACARNDSEWRVSE